MLFTTNTEILQPPEFVRRAALCAHDHEHTKNYSAATRDCEKGSAVCLSTKSYSAAIRTCEKGRPVRLCLHKASGKGKPLRCCLHRPTEEPPEIVRRAMLYACDFKHTKSCSAASRALGGKVQTHRDLQCSHQIKKCNG